MAEEIVKEVEGLDRQAGLSNTPHFVLNTNPAGGRFGAIGSAFTATAVAATDGANVTLITITIKDIAGTAIAYPEVFDVILSDAASGFGVTATTASGTVAGKTDGTTGKDLQIYVTKKAFRVQATASGTYQLSITDTAKTLFKIVVCLAGRPFVVLTLVVGNYG